MSKTLNKTFLSIHDLGLVCPLGADHKTILQKLIAGDTCGMVFDESLGHVVGKVSHSFADECLEMQANPDLNIYNCRNNQLAMAALKQIQPSVETLKTRYGQHRIAVVMGTSTSGVSATEDALAYTLKHSSPPQGYHYRQQELGGLAEFSAAYLGVTGIAYSLSTACSSSAHVFNSAQRLLSLNLCDAVIIGGVDSLCQLTLQGFSALASTSQHRCAPFSKTRDGINIGEAAAVFILSREESEIQLKGIGCCSDAHHISAPDPSGKGAITSMNNALNNAGLAHNAIDYLNLHGTGTQLNDMMESHAVYSIFSDTVPCSSTKAITGHTLGASGAMELAFCWLLLNANNSQLPPQKGAYQKDEELAPIQLVRQNQTTLRPITHCMSNAFAFGGNNISLIIGKNL